MHHPRQDSTYHGLCYTSRGELYQQTTKRWLLGANVHWRRKRRGGGGEMVCLCPPPSPLLTPHFHFPLELYVYITLTNNYLAFFIYQLIILWTISINWHRWLLVNNHISKYNSFILLLYRRYINYVYVCPPPPPPPHTHTFWHLPTPLM